MKGIIFDRFQARLEDLGLVIDTVDSEGLIQITVAENNTLAISLENVRKSYEQDGTFSHLDSLVESIHSYLIGNIIPDWESSKYSLYLSLFPSDFDFKDFINEPVTNDFNKYYVYSNGSQQTWIDRHQLEDWGVDEQLFKDQVSANMNRLLDESRFELLVLENGATLGYFETEIEEFKSSLLFADALKKKISKAIGWPVCAVLPVRDFCYMFSSKEKGDIIDALGAVVTEEYNKLGYEITKEIIEISDDGIKGIGKYED